MSKTFQMYENAFSGRSAPASLGSLWRFPETLDELKGRKGGRRREEVRLLLMDVLLLAKKIRGVAHSRIYCLHTTRRSTEQDIITDILVNTTITRSAKFSSKCTGNYMTYGTYSEL